MAHGAAAAKFNGWVAVRSRLAPMVTGGDDENADEDDDEEDEAPGDDEHAGESDDDDGEDTASENDEDDVDPRLAAARRARRRRTRRRYRPYETLLLLEDAASTLRDLPRDAAPQLRALVAHADPFATFHAIAARAGLPLPRVYRLARHLCEWKRARVIAVVRPDAVYAVDEVPLSIPVDARDAVRASDAMILAAFGPCKRLGDALDVLETTRGRDAATERVLALLRRGALRELHPTSLRRRVGRRGAAAASRFRSGRDGGARQAGAGRAVGPPSFIARLPGAVALLRRQLACPAPSPLEDRSMRDDGRQDRSVVGKG